MNIRHLFSLIAAVLIMSQAIAAEDKKISRKMGDSGITTENDKTVFYAKANKLKLPKVHVIDVNGNMTNKLYAAELDLSKFVEGEALEFKLIKLDETDVYGCIAPETWQESMGHCMVQN